jgi:molybdenum cofactor cytidylyltransferase
MGISALQPALQFQLRLPYTFDVRELDANRPAIGAIILAAGASRRMGKPKLLLPWGATSVLGRLLQQCKTVGARQTAVVCAAGGQTLAEELDKLDFPKSDRIFNPAPERGMFSSVQCAANWTGWTPELTHWLLMLGDQPHLQDRTLETLLRFSARSPDKICQPMRNAHRKHPVLLPRQAFAELRNTAAGDLKVFLVEHAKDLSGFESADQGLDLDMDTPEDYETAKRMFFG